VIVSQRRPRLPLPLVPWILLVLGEVDFVTPPSCALRGRPAFLGASEAEGLMCGGDAAGWPLGVRVRFAGAITTGCDGGELEFLTAILALRRGDGSDSGGDGDAAATSACCSSLLEP
jgi:hypothetical protein